MSEIPVIAICPTIFDIPQFENLRRVQAASFRDVCDIEYCGEEWSGWMEQWTTQDKIVHLYKTAIEKFPGVVDRGYVLLLHHDVVLENKDLFWDLVYYVAEKGYAVAGPSENDGVMRNNYNGRHYCHSAFMLIDPRKVGRWYEVDEWIENGWVQNGVEYRLRGMDRYWKICHGVLGNILYLKSEWRNPRMGKATWVMYRGAPIATHLWLSTGDIRAHRKWQTIEGDDPVEVADWRSQFCGYYAAKFGVELVSCEDTVRGLDYYRRWRLEECGRNS